MLINHRAMITYRKTKRRAMQNKSDQPELSEGAACRAFFSSRVSRTMIVLLVFGAIAAFTGCERKPAQTPLGKIRIAVSPWPASAALYVAKNKGYFKDEGLDAAIEPIVSGNLGLDAVAKGKTEFSAVTDAPIAFAAVDGKPVSVIATISKIDEGVLIIARKDRGILAPGDLKGKKIGLLPGTAAEYFLELYLTTSNINPRNVNVVSVEADKVVDALLSGEVDAVSTWSPHTVKLRDKLGGNALVLEDPDIYDSTWNLVVKKNYAKRSPKVIEKFLRAVVKANSFIENRPKEAQAISEKFIGISSPLFKKEWKNYRFAVELDQSLILTLEDQARWVVEKKGREAGGTPNFLDYIYSDGLKAVQPEAVRIPGK